MAGGSSVPCRRWAASFVDSFRENPQNTNSLPTSDTRFITYGTYVTPLDSPSLRGYGLACTALENQRPSSQKYLIPEVCPFERAKEAILEVMVTVATITEQVEQLLSLMREVDLPTLLALDRELHLLLEQRGGKKLWIRQGTTVQAEFCQRYPHIAVDPDSFALVGFHLNIPWRKTKP